MFGIQFYPTPKELTYELLDMLGQDVNHKIENILESSAGKGDMADAAVEFYKNLKADWKGKTYNIGHEVKIDTIEIDQNLQAVLKSKGYPVIHDDFLSYAGYQKFDLIIMNPPFQDGDKHLLKAIQVAERGGTILCILNAETIRNPYSKYRKDLLNKIDKYDGKVVFKTSAFTDAERTTDVEVALVKIEVPEKVESDYLNGMKARIEQEKRWNEEDYQFLVKDNPLEAIIDEFNLEVRMGLELIREVRAINQVFGGILKLEPANKYQENSHGDENSFIRGTRRKYWSKLFNLSEFRKVMTSNESYSLNNKLEEYANYDLTEHNIYQLRINLVEALTGNIEDSIERVFDEMTALYSYDQDVKNGNIHYYNGWKSNKAYKVNKKVVINRSAYGWFDGLVSHSEAGEFVQDLSMILGYLDGKRVDDLEIKPADTLKHMEDTQQDKKLDFGYYTMDTFKKGTVHIKFKDFDLLDRLNRYVGAKKGWLPPSYGQKVYEDMTEEEKAVINDFEGEKEYKKAYVTGKLQLADTGLVALMAK